MQINLFRDSLIGDFGHSMLIRKSNIEQKAFCGKHFSCSVKGRVQLLKKKKKKERKKERKIINAFKALQILLPLEPNKCSSN